MNALRADSTVREVVDTMLSAVMPKAMNDQQIVDLVEAVMDDPIVRQHDGKRWRDLSRRHESAITRVIGQVAARAILDEAKATRSAE